MSLLVLALCAILTFSCRVAKGESAYIEEDADFAPPCTALSCLNDGTCISIGNADFMCTCKVGYYGDQCEKKLPCAGDPCLNGGSCVTLSRQLFRCQCPNGYQGDTCQHASPCLSEPCQHGGTCTLIPEPVHTVPDDSVTRGAPEILTTSEPETPAMTYTCDCHNGYFGENCERLMPCKTYPCQNRGTCIDVDEATFRCLCPSGKTGRTCENDVMCDTGEEFAKRHNALMSSRQVRRSSRHGMTKEVTCLSDYHVQPQMWSTSIRCDIDGFWTMQVNCIPITCPIIALENADVMQGDAVIGDIVSYNCKPGYKMIGNDSVICTSDNNRYRQVSLKPVGGTWPFCLPYEGCPDPPSITWASLLTVNSTEQFGEAKYRCDSGYIQEGDGKARCWRTSSEAIYDRRNGHYHHVDKHQWVFLPKCVPVCQVQEGKSGNRSKAMVKVTRCNTSSFARYPREQCGEPAVYQVTQSETRKDVSMVFYGEELCVAVNYVTNKYYLMQSVNPNVEQYIEKCVNFCIPHRHGFRRVIVQDNMTYYKGNITLERVLYKYQSF